MSESGEGTIGGNGAGTIVVGVDGSPASAQALRWAVALSRLTGGEVRAVNAWLPPTAYGWGPVVDDIDWEENGRAVLATTVKETIPGADGERIRQDVVRGHPAQVLVDAGAGAELIVVGNRGHGGVAGMLLGSVSRHVSAHAPCPVLVVHEDDAAPGGPVG